MEPGSRGSPLAVAPTERPEPEEDAMSLEEDLPDQPDAADDEAGEGDEGLTSPPPGAGNQATTPPGNPDVDEDALEKSEEGLEQAGGGH